MIEHIVLFKMKPNATEDDKRRLVTALKAMKDRIPGMVDLSAGETFTDRHQGFVVGLVTRFEDEQSLENYGPHPLHQPVKDLVAQLCDDVLAVDYHI